jgi:hypothetical protein
MGRRAAHAAKRLDRDDWQAVSLAALELPALEAGVAPGLRIRWAG